MSLHDLPATLHRLVPLRAEVDLEALRHNVRVLQGRAGAAELIAAIKADAYGHGVIPITRVLVEEGVPRFAVANVPEGVELREAGIEAPVHVLGAPLPEYLPAYARYDLIVTVSSGDVAEAVIEAATKVGPLTAHLKVDTGMHRLGIPPDEVPPVLARLQETPGIEVEGLWTHFATLGDAFTTEQLARFDALVEQLDGIGRAGTHVTNTGTLFLVSGAVQGRAFVRAGGALFGLVDDPAVAAEADDLKPVMRLVSRVVHLQTVAAGETVSYGRTWTADQPTCIATVAAGYGDGLPRSLSNTGFVGIGGRLWPIAGRVCMDMLMLDLGSPEGPGASVQIGDEAVLFGPGGPSAAEVARQAGTITYALTSGLTARVPRLTIGEGSASAIPTPTGAKPDRVSV
ncbi:MAG: alanine racemase [Rhodothermaceae bacterium]|nr:alanine racemase [Rhodothermaceae bacterium]